MDRESEVERKKKETVPNRKTRSQTEHGCMAHSLRIGLASGVIVEAEAFEPWTELPRFVN